MASSIWQFARARRRPTRRAVAALAKMNGLKLQRRWPFLAAADPLHLNLGFDDVLEFQYARSRSFQVLVVGAYDGVANDPLGKFVLSRPCSGIFVEPQTGVFKRLRKNLGDGPQFHFVNAAIDQSSGTREFFHVRSGTVGLPAWTEQLASFHREHIAKHEDRAPGLSQYIASTMVRTLSFPDLLSQFQLSSMDVLQIDAEGVDALLLGWFPFDSVKPGVVHYEIAHMSPDELDATRVRLKRHGYRLYPTESPMDEMAILL
jgi:FkbM family methyltransferase